MHALIGWIDLRGEPFNIGGFQLGQLAPFQHLAGQFHALDTEFFQHRRIGGIGAGLALAPARKPHFIKQNFTQLLGRSNIEGTACKLMNSSFQHREAPREIFPNARQFRAIHLHAGSFHIAQNGDHAAFDLFITCQRTIGAQTRAQ